jgi:hypothetical protein
MWDSIKIHKYGWPPLTLGRFETLGVTKKFVKKSEG